MDSNQPAGFQDYGQHYKVLIYALVNPWNGFAAWSKSPPPLVVPLTVFAMDAGLHLAKAIVKQSSLSQELLLILLALSIPLAAGSLLLRLLGVPASFARIVIVMATADAVTIPNMIDQPTGGLSLAMYVIFQLAILAWYVIITGVGFSRMTPASPARGAIVAIGAILVTLILGAMLTPGVSPAG